MDRDVRIYVQQRQRANRTRKRKRRTIPNLSGSMLRFVSKRCNARARTGKRAEKVWSCEITDFYSPPLCDWIEKAVKKNFGDAIVCDRTGGYRGAEQQRMLLARPENSEELFELAKNDEFSRTKEKMEKERWDTSNCAIACVNISGMFAFDPASHPDFLGAVLGAGVKREKIWQDILVNSSSEVSESLSTPAIAVFLTRALESVRTVKVNVDLFPLSELKQAKGLRCRSLCARTKRRFG